MELIAKYEARGNATVTITTINGAQYTVGASSTAQSGGTESVPLGSTLTLAAVDSGSFLQWQNESSKVLGRSATLNVTVTGNMSITLVYKASATENQAYVQLRWFLPLHRVRQPLQTASISTVIFVTPSRITL